MLLKQQFEHIHIRQNELFDLCWEIERRYKAKIKCQQINEKTYVYVVLVQCSRLWHHIKLSRWPSWLRGRSRNVRRQEISEFWYVWWLELTRVTHTKSFWTDWCVCGCKHSWLDLDCHTTMRWPCGYSSSLIMCQLNSSVQKMGGIFPNNAVIYQACWARFSLLAISMVFTILFQNLLSCFATNRHSFRCFQSKTTCLLLAHKQRPCKHHNATSISSLSFLWCLQTRCWC